MTVRCGIPLTVGYIETRLRELRDTAHPRTIEFAYKYGEAYTQQIIRWFEQAARGDSRPAPPPSYGRPLLYSRRSPYDQYANRDMCSSLLQPQQLLAEHARLRAADFELLGVGERHEEGAAGHMSHAADGLDVHERASVEPDEAMGIEPAF